jgi:hypothetical protein
MSLQDNMDIQSLYEIIETTHQICCEKCSRRDFRYNTESHEAAETFFKKGWRVKDDTTYCPDCVKTITP